MIQLPNNIYPSQACLTELATFQAEIDTIPTFVEQKKCIEQEWHNKSRRKVFDEVHEKLTNMCQGAKRCMYCEDSAADEVEHIYPKNLYPNKAFVWDNYLYACGTCNSPKKNAFALFLPTSVKYQEIKSSNIAPPNGEMVLINPRNENGLDFMMLDLIDTFQFVELGETATKSYQKAVYSIHVLTLNNREYLCEARRNAYSNYKSRLIAYLHKRDIEKANPNELENIIKELKREGHKTVWQEMKRQAGYIKDLSKLFERIPEAMNW